MVAQSAASFNALVKDLKMLPRLAEQRALEVVLVLMPESSRSSAVAHWTTNPPVPKLSSRADSESVIADGGSRTTAQPGPNSNNSLPEFHDWMAAAPRVSIPACFLSANSCITQTHHCSGHGECKDKYEVNGGGGPAQPVGDEPPAVCFVCHCNSTLKEPAKDGQGFSTTLWAGNMCQKIDISVPFWLITGFTVTIVGAVSFAIGLLFSVGEEKLPGVIGAGVSRK